MCHHAQPSLFTSYFEKVLSCPRWHCAQLWLKKSLSVLSSCLSLLVGWDDGRPAPSGSDRQAQLCAVACGPMGVPGTSPLHSKTDVGRGSVDIIKTPVSGEKPPRAQTYTQPPFLWMIDWKGCVWRAGGSAEQPSPRGQWRAHISVFPFRSQPPPGKPECRVGQYVVDLASFEQLALPVLRNVSLRFLS